VLPVIQCRDEFFCPSCGEAMRVYGVVVDGKVEWRSIHSCGVPPGYDGPPGGEERRVVLKR